MSKSAKVVQFQLLAVVMIFDENGDACDTRQSQATVHAAQFDQSFREIATQLEKKAAEELRVEVAQATPVDPALEPDVNDMPVTPQRVTSVEAVADDNEEWDVD